MPREVPGPAQGARPLGVPTPVAVIVYVVVSLGFAAAVKFEAAPGWSWWQACLAGAGLGLLVLVVGWVKGTAMNGGGKGEGG